MLDSTIVADLLETYSHDPFYSPVQFCKEHNINGNILKEIVYNVKRTKHLSTIVLQGPAKQYWKSIESIRNQTNFDSAVQSKSAYPSRIGFYPGVTCQFACSFCGRREGTQFAGDLARSSVDMFNDILDVHVQVPNHQKIIRLSGGLEPTTNKHISDIILGIKRKNLQAEMYTNGFNFTNNWLDMNLGINLLDRIRFSIYGHDADSYKQTTGHDRGHTVLGKVKNFLNRSSMPVGVNYVVLQGQLDRFEKFIQWVKEVNNETRGLDWVSIREDSSQHRWNLDQEERTNIKSLLDQLNSVCKNVDYGYTLWPLQFDKSIGQIKHADLPLAHGFPQISTVIDVAGDVYSYHDVFPNRAGQAKHVLGNVKQDSLQNIVTNWLATPGVQVSKDDLKFLDTSDHMITMLIKQQKELDNLGIDQWLV